MEENVCRICLQTNSGEEEMCSIYTSDDHGKLISNKIKTCCGVKLPKESDGFPTKICSKCKVFLGIAYKLRTICQNSDAYLRRFKAKEMEMEDNEDVELKKEEAEVTEMLKNYEDETNTEPSFLEIKEEYAIQMEILESNNEDITYENYEELKDEQYPEKSEEIGTPVGNFTINEIRSPTTLPKETKKKDKKVPKTKGKKYGICPYCGDSYTMSSLSLHIRRHTGEKPYKCDVCEKAFVELHDLKRHKRSHTGERPHVCAVCGKAFSQQGKLARHNLIHTGEKPYKCDLCERSFTQRNELNLHVRRHTGVKPYSCGICGESFLTGTFLRNHQKSMGHFEEDKKDRFVKIRVSSLSRSYRRRGPQTAEESAK